MAVKASLGIRLVAIAIAISVLNGCVALVATGAAVGVMAAMDRRTVGTQTEDQGIEIKAWDAIRSKVNQSSGISVTSFNRKVLLTGQVLDEQAKRDAETVAKVGNVQRVFNELSVNSRASFTTSTVDAATTSRIKGAFLQASDLSTNQFKVVTESGTAYLMGVVTQREGDRAAQVASRVPGVKNVVTVFDYITDEELAGIEATRRNNK